MPSSGQAASSALKPRADAAPNQHAAVADVKTSSTSSRRPRSAPRTGQPDMFTERPAAPMNVHDRADVSRLQAVTGNVLREHDAIMFFQHLASRKPRRRRA